MKKEDFIGKWVTEGFTPVKITEENFDLLDKRSAIVDFLTFESKEKANLSIWEDLWLGSERTLRLVKKKKVYISGPISGHNIEDRRKAFEQVAVMLGEKGYLPINPMWNGLAADAPSIHHMRKDLKFLNYCDAIYLMKGWNHSAGCHTEVMNATAIGLTFMFEDVPGDVKFE